MIKIEAIHYFAERGGMGFHRYPDNSISVVELRGTGWAQASASVRAVAHHRSGGKLPTARLVVFDDEFRAVFAGAGAEQGYYVALHGAGPARDWL